VPTKNSVCPYKHSAARRIRDLADVLVLPALSNVLGNAVRVFGHYGTADVLEESYSPRAGSHSAAEAADSPSRSHPLTGAPVGSCSSKRTIKRSLSSARSRFLTARVLISAPSPISWAWVFAHGVQAPAPRRTGQDGCHAAIRRLPKATGSETTPSTNKSVTQSGHTDRKPFIINRFDKVCKTFIRRFDPAPRLQQVEENNRASARTLADGTGQKWAKRSRSGPLGRTKSRTRTGFLSGLPPLLEPLRVVIAVLDSSRSVSFLVRSRN
jgi:hypothetical protein